MIKFKFIYLFIFLKNGVKLKKTQTTTPIKLPCMLLNSKENWLLHSFKEKCCFLFPSKHLIKNYNSQCTSGLQTPKG